MKWTTSSGTAPSESTAPPGCALLAVVSLMLEAGAGAGVNAASDARHRGAGAPALPSVPIPSKTRSASSAAPRRSLVVPLGLYSKQQA